MSRARAHRLSRSAAWLSASAVPLLFTVCCGADREISIGQNASPEAEQEPKQELVVSQLSAAWTTPHWIRWAWKVEGDPSRFDQYRLVLGSSESEVVDQAASTTSLDAQSNPELGLFVLPQTDIAPVQATLSGDCVPDRDYFAQLLVVYTDGSVSRSNVAHTRTAPEPSGGEIQLLTDESTPGTSLPVEFVESDEYPYAGVHHFRFAACPGGESACYENLRRQGLNPDLLAMSEEAFRSTAYFEVAVSYEADVPSYWSQFRVLVGQSPNRALLGFDPWTIPGRRAYRLYEIPVAVLRNDTGFLQFSDWQSGLYEVGVGGNWKGGSVVRIDEVRIRW